MLKLFLEALLAIAASLVTWLAQLYGTSIAGYIRDNRSYGSEHRPGFVD